VPRRSLDAELAALRADPDAHLGVNDLEPAARSLCPEIDERLAALREAGAAHAFVAGSGPTVAGLFATSEDAALAAASLAHLASAPIATGSADPSEA
jgi:4-diphosphocytidyl-2-C-methyl-D-erythritol kinase